jgi:hypothetical protein
MGADGIGCSSGIEATVDIDPDVLNPRSRRRWLTCYLELGGGHDPQDIDVSTVLLNGVVWAEMRPTTVGDHDADGIADRMVKFSWSDVLASLEGFGDVEIEVSGQAGGETFSGTDTVLVLLKDRWKTRFADGPGHHVADDVKITSPGPTGDGVTIEFSVPDDSHVRVTVYDARGKVVRKLIDEVKPADSYSTHWDAKDASENSIAPGIYFVSFEAGEHRETRKVAIVR